MFGLEGCELGVQNLSVDHNENKHIENNIYEEEKIYPVTEDLIGVVKEGTLSCGEATILLTNRNKYDYYEFGQGNDVIEQNVNGQWQKVAIKKDNIATVDVLWSMLPNSTMDYNADWLEKYGELSTGEYRLRKTVTKVAKDKTEENYFLYVEFEIKETITKQVTFLNFAPGFSEAGDMEDADFYEHKPDDSGFISYYSADYSSVMSLYQADVDSEDLYAFVVQMGTYENEKPADYPVYKGTEQERLLIKQEYHARKIAEMLKGTNLYLVEDYPYNFRIINYSGPYAVYDSKTKTFSYSEEYGPGVCVVGKISDFVALCEKGEAINGWYCRFISAVRPDIVKLATESTNEDCACDLWGHHLATYFSCSHEENREVILSVNLYKP